MANSKTYRTLYCFIPIKYTIYCISPLLPSHKKMSLYCSFFIFLYTFPVYHYFILVKASNILFHTCILKTQQRFCLIFKESKSQNVVFVFYYYCYLSKQKCSGQIVKTTCGVSIKYDSVDFHPLLNWYCGFCHTVNWLVTCPRITRSASIHVPCKHRSCPPFLQSS